MCPFNLCYFEIIRLIFSSYTGLRKKHISIHCSLRANMDIMLTVCPAGQIQRNNKKKKKQIKKNIYIYQWLETQAAYKACTLYFFSYQKVKCYQNTNSNIFTLTIRLYIFFCPIRSYSGKKKMKANEELESHLYIIVCIKEGNKTAPSILYRLGFAVHLN